MDFSPESFGSFTRKLNWVETSKCRENLVKEFLLRTLIIIKIKDFLTNNFIKIILKNCTVLKIFFCLLFFLKLKYLIFQNLFWSIFIVCQLINCYFNIFYKQVFFINICSPNYLYRYKSILSMNWNSLWKEFFKGISQRAFDNIPEHREKYPFHPALVNFPHIIENVSASCYEDWKDLNSLKVKIKLTSSWLVLLFS